MKIDRNHLPNVVAQEGRPILGRAITTSPHHVLGDRPLSHGNAQIEIYKEWIRPLINLGDLYHISTRPDEAPWDGMEYVDSKTGKHVVFAFICVSQGKDG